MNAPLNYRLTRKLGEGGVGEVYLADDLRLQRQVAIKLLPTNFIGDAERQQRFIAEAGAASALNHPNVCVVHEVRQADDGRQLNVLELLQGQPLDKLAGQGSLESARIVDFAMQVADALDAAHANGVVDRDIKPARQNWTRREPA